MTTTRHHDDGLRAQDSDARSPEGHETRPRPAEAGQLAEVGADELRQAVERLHDCRARLSEVVRVTEAFQGAPAWDGVVHVFWVSDHPSATTCFAWSSPVENSDRRRFYAVLKQPPVATANDAVRASIITDYRATISK